MLSLSVSQAINERLNFSYLEQTVYAGSTRLHSSHSNMTPLLLTCCTLAENGSCFGLLSVLARNGRSLSEFLFLKASQKSKIVIFLSEHVYTYKQFKQEFWESSSNDRATLTRGDTKRSMCLTKSILSLLHNPTLFFLYQKL